MLYIFFLSQFAFIRYNYRKQHINFKTLSKWHVICYKHYLTIYSLKKTISRYNRRMELKMKEHKMKQLDAKLKKMLQQADQSEGKFLEPTTRFQNGNVIFIRRRKGKENGVYVTRKKSRIRVKGN